MPAPSQHPTWATDTNFTNGGAGIAGTPTKVEPSAGVKAEGHVPGTAAPAQRMNWWKNLVGLWTTWLEAERAAHAAILRPDLTVRSAYFPALRAKSEESNWTPSTFKILSLDVAVAYFSAMAGDPLPHDCTITSVRVWVKPGAARATEGDRMRFQAFRVPASGFSPVLLDTVYDDGGTTLQELLISGLSIQMRGDSSAGYALTNIGLAFTVRSGTTGQPASDEVHLAEVQYTLNIR